MSQFDTAMTLPPGDRSHDRAFERPAAHAGDPGGAPGADARTGSQKSVPRIWVMCRKVAGSGAVENIRAYEDESRARADLELAEAVSDDEFWLAAVPFLEGDRFAAATSVQKLALTWLSQGAEAEVSIPDDDPVVINPRHVRGFVSVPPDEWRRMEERGWVRNGMITAEGKAQLDR